jgi:hypothetical protein
LILKRLGIQAALQLALLKHTRHFQVAATGAGRMVSFFWLFFGVLVFSVFLGNVMSTINVQIAEAAIDGPSTLGGFNVRILKLLRESDAHFVLPNSSLSLLQLS